MNIRSAVLERLKAELSCSNQMSAEGGPATCLSVQSRLKFLKVKITWSRVLTLCCVLWRRTFKAKGALSLHFAYMYVCMYVCKAYIRQKPDWTDLTDLNSSLFSFCKSGTYFEQYLITYHDTFSVHYLTLSLQYSQYRP